MKELIQAVLAKHTGNGEFALFRFPAHLSNWRTGEWAPESWRAEIGNPNVHVMLGEISGEFCGDGATPEAALEALLAALERASSPTAAD